MKAKSNGPEPKIEKDTSEDGQKFTRWYDKEEILSRVVHRLEHMKPEYQQLFAQVIISASDHIRSELRMRKGYVGLGNPGKVKGLMKTQDRKRWYDKEDSLRKAFKRLYIVDEDNQAILAQRVNETIYCIEEYCMFCERRKIKQDHKVILNLCSKVAYKGFEAGKRYLMREELWDMECWRTCPVSGDNLVLMSEEYIQVVKSHMQSGELEDMDQPVYLTYSSEGGMKLENEEKEEK